MEAPDHVEKVVRGALLMGQDEHLPPAPHRRAMIEPRPDVGGQALLPRLQHQGPHLAGRGALHLQPLVQPALRPVQLQPGDPPVLAADAEAASSKERQIKL